MLLTLIVSHLFVLIAANPFHKYPYVFLLDVGNEEIQRTKSEQIRVSIPGGTLALRYPAIGEKDTIAHVRVSGIDFGTDLKANIIDGGPGYKYVVIVFTGNQGMPYDAVVTIQTMDNKEKQFNPQDISTNNIDSSVYEVSENENNSAEEIDNPEYAPKEDSSHLNQASEHQYKYAENEAVGDHDFKDDVVSVNSVDSNDDDDDDYNDDNSNQNQQIDTKKYESVNYDDGNDDTDGDDDKDEINTKGEYSLNNGYTANEYYNKEETVGVVDNLYYDRANYIRPFLYNGIRVFPEQVQYMPGGGAKLGAGDDEGYVDDIHNEGENINFKDTNNNNFDSDDSSAVAS